jgi:hypothetical protein
VGEARGEAQEAAVKVYVVTSGEYSDYQIRHVFARREDAESYPLGDAVKEMEVHEGPVETRPWHALTWNPALPDGKARTDSHDNPYELSWPQDFDGDERHLTHQWHRGGMTGPVLYIGGWDLQRVRKAYSEQRAQHLARTSDFR